MGCVFEQWARPGLHMTGISLQSVTMLVVDVLAATSFDLQKSNKSGSGDDSEHDYVNLPVNEKVVMRPKKGNLLQKSASSTSAHKQSNNTQHIAQYEGKM